MSYHHHDWTWPVLEVIRVVDGDTLDVVLDRGFGVRTALRFRLDGVNAHEIYGKNASEAGRVAKRFVEQWLEERKGHLVLRSTKGSPGAVGIGDGAFGRWAGVVVDDRDGSSLGDVLVAEGHAELSPPS